MHDLQGRVSMECDRPKESDLLVVIAGPTGSGKSHLGLKLARHLGGEIVSADSVQVFRGFDLGSAKATAEEQVLVPHHLIDVADPQDRFSAGDFQRLGRMALLQIRSRGRLPLVAGGTGLYLTALLDGLFEQTAPPDERWRSALVDRDQVRPGLLHRWLRRLDSVAATGIPATNLHRVIRALEIARASGQSVGEAHQQNPAQPLVGFRTVRILLDPPRDQLRQRLHLRTQKMFASGLIEEAQQLLSAGVPRSCKAWETIGYRQALQVVDGQLSLEEAIAEVALRTGQYAKRQSTWFRRDAQMRPIGLFGDDPRAFDMALAMISASV
jgi:tRNA dimethylallyltransferase